MIISGIMANGVFYMPKTAWICGRMAVADLNGNCGVIDEDGNPIGRIWYKNVLWFNKCGAACEKHDGHVVILDQYGYELHDIFEDAHEVYGHYAVGKKSGKWCYVNIKTHQVSEPFFDAMLFWKIDCGAIVCCNNRYSAIDVEGRLLAEFIYDDAHHLNEEHFALKLAGKYAVTGPNGLIVPEPVLDRIGLFRDGVANATKDGETGYVTIEKGWTKTI